MLSHKKQKQNNPLIYLNFMPKMENKTSNNSFDQRTQIINELLQGLNSAKQLQNQITTNKTTFLSDNYCNDNNQTLDCSLLILLEKMMSTFDKTISIAKQINPSNHYNHSIHHHLQLPQSLAIVDSPKSENPSKRRKMMPKWTKTVEVDPGKVISGLEGPLSDGFSWRKYGQKVILGAKFPRNYYRCTHRPTKGCAATKQVQQSDNNASIYQVIYKNEHTCYPSPKLNPAQLKPISTQNDKIKPHKSPISKPVTHKPLTGLSPEKDSRIKPDEFVDKAQIFRSFSLESTLLEAKPLDENYMLSYSPEFATSPTTSDSSGFPTLTYWSIAPGIGLNVQVSEDDVNGTISGPDSVSNSPTMGDFDFSFDQWLDLDVNFFSLSN